jgi:hypothetical protein
MKVAIITGSSAKWDMNVYAGQSIEFFVISKFKITIPYHGIRV